MTSLTRAPCTRKRLIERLEKQGFDASTAESATDEMERVGYLDDRALGESVARSVLRKGPAGERLLVERQVKRGISRALAQEIARAALAETDPQAEADRAASAKVRAMPGALDETVVVRRVTSYLARRGVAPGVAHEAVRRAIRERDAS